MAATDQNYRNQKTLDVVFAASCVLMLISIIWMFWDDYAREWKKEQRVFRDVQQAMSERFALAKLPDPQDLRAAEKEVDRGEKRLRYSKPRLREIDEEIDRLRPELVKADNKIRGVKADLDSWQSFYDIEVDKHGPNSADALRLKEEIRGQRDKLDAAVAEFDQVKRKTKELEAERDRTNQPVQEAKAKLKKLREDFDLQVKLAGNYRWKFGDWFRNLPILDAFHSPTRIQQFTLNDLPIDYSFKYVTRFDRCTTCHLGIDKPGYDREALHGLAYTPDQLLDMAELDHQLRDLQQKVNARERDEEFEEMTGRLRRLALAYQGAGHWAGPTAGPLLTRLGADVEGAAGAPTDTGLKQLRARVKTLKASPAIKDEDKRINSRLVKDLPKTKVELTEARVNEFRTHPRLDLFVDGNSPHAAEKFGCTICHGGQGSATAFFYASHTPTDSAQKRRWEKEHGWKANHDWEFPMQPHRFVESGCLKCHYQVTDLIREGNKNEAPKLVRGYNIVREFGCFGCHEISGIKGGRAVGPDLRLEPFPALDQLTAEERVKLRSDPLNLPGTMRKVGPSLFRLTEKTHRDWVKRWIKSPRGFRPTTKMPHFYGLSNNDPRQDLAGTEQKAFPDAEIESITHYLFYESAAYLEDADSTRRADYLKITEKFDKVYPLRKLEAERHGVPRQIEKHEVEVERLKKSRARAKDAEEKKTLAAEIKSGEAAIARANRRLKKLDADIAGVRVELRKAQIDPDTLLRFEHLLEQKAPTDPAKLRAWQERDLKALRDAEDKLQLLTRLDGLRASDRLNDMEKRELAEAKRQLELRGKIVTLAEKFKQSAGSTKLPDSGQLIKNGRRLFTEKGCLACHSHRAVAEPGPGLFSPDPTRPDKLVDVKMPAIDREQYYKDQPTLAAFGPNLSMLVEKLGTDEPDNAGSKRRWLTQWIMDPTFHSPRTLMPVTHLTYEEASAVAAWLLAQGPQESAADWKKVKVTDYSADEPEETKVKTLKELARVTLGKVLSESDIKDLFEGKYTGDKVNFLMADERELARLIESDARGMRKPLRENSKGLVNPLKWYIGKKAINRQGCFGCHNVPGFEQAKPIGTPLNDWGKKDPERLAFEDIEHYVKDHYQFVDQLTSKKGQPLRRKKGQKPYYENFFKDALFHHAREGFLHQKLKDPRSYDYNRMRAWDERLRMPQFKFARTKQLPGEKPAAFQARAEVEEAAAREAVMTFILGLVAEPIPEKFVHAPGPDRLAEVKGRQVLDKFNCASCHLLRSGVYDFKLSERLLKTKGGLNDQRKNWAEDYATKHVFAEHNAWISPRPPSQDRVRLYGILAQGDEDTSPTVKLTEAVRYARNKRESGDIPASAAIALPVDKKTKKIVDLIDEVAPLGGHFSDMLGPVFIHLYTKEDSVKEVTFVAKFGEDYARAFLPPSLLREGEKVQPNWLFQFLKNPQPIRPMARLRMPRFNLSDEEAMALVNYFASVDKVTNPGIGLTYPYGNVPEKADAYLLERGQEYVGRLRRQRADWEKALTELIALEDKKIKDAADKLKQATTDAARKEANDLRLGAEKQKKELEDRKKEWLLIVENKEDKLPQGAWDPGTVYVRDGFRLLSTLSSDQLCLSCHQVGNLKAGQPLAGPPLQLAEDRLRPDWTLRWIAYPQRMLAYPSIMPTNFERGKQGYQHLFVAGSALDYVTACRDVLMNFRKVADMPANRSRPAPPAGGK
jgi:mono/diheme cytochrome c family protein